MNRKALVLSLLVGLSAAIAMLVRWTRSCVRGSVVASFDRFQGRHHFRKEAPAAVAS
jgi:hypothetical protein